MSTTAGGGGGDNFFCVAFVGFFVGFFVGLLVCRRVGRRFFVGLLFTDLVDLLRVGLLFLVGFLRMGFFAATASAARRGSAVTSKGLMPLCAAPSCSWSPPPSSCTSKPCEASPLQTCRLHGMVCACSTAQTS